MSYTNFNNYGVQKDGTSFRIISNTIPLQFYELGANPDGVATIGNITIDEDYLATIYPVFQVRIDNNLITSKAAPNNFVQLDLPNDAHSRIDAIYVTSDGSYGKVTGDAVESPFPSNVPDGTVKIADVFVYFAGSSVPDIDIQPVTEYYKNTGGDISGPVRIKGGNDLIRLPRFGSRDTGDDVYLNPDGSEAARRSYGGADGEFFGVKFQGGETFKEIHTGNIVGEVIKDDVIAEDSAWSSEKANDVVEAERDRAIAVEDTKANLTEITEDVIIAYGDPNLSGNNYTNLALANKTVQLAYTNNSGPQLPYVTFNSSGVGVLPDVPESGNPNSNITIRAKSLTIDYVSKSEIGIKEYKYIGQTLSLVSRFPTTGGVVSVTTPIETDEAYGKKITTSGAGTYTHIFSSPVSNPATLNLKKISISAIENRTPVSSQDGIGLCFGDISNPANPLTIYLYRCGGMILKVEYSNNTTASVNTIIRADTAGVDYTLNDEVKAEVVYDLSNGVTINFYKNGTLNFTKEEPLPKTGFVYPTYRSTSIYTFKVNAEYLDAVLAKKLNNIEQDLSDEIDGIKDVLTRELDFSIIPLGSIFPVDVSSAVITLSEVDYGLNAVISGGGSSSLKMISCESFDDFINRKTDLFRLIARFKINTVNLNQGVGFGFGSSDLDRVFGVYLSPGGLSKFTNSSLSYSTLRATNAAYAYTSGDVVEVIADLFPSLNKITLYTSLNGVQDSTGYDVTIADFTNLVFCYRSTGMNVDMKVLSYGQQAVTGGGGGISGGIPTGFNEISIVDGNLTSYDENGDYIILPAGAKGAGKAQFVGMATAVSISIPLGGVNDIYIVSSPTLELISVTPTSGGVTFTRNSGGASDLIINWFRIAL